VLGGHVVQCLGSKTEKLAIADGVHIHRRRAAAEHERLAQGSPAKVFEDGVAAPVVIDVGSSESAVRDEDEWDVLLAPLDDAGAPSHVARYEGSSQVMQRLGIHFATDGPVPEQT